METQQETEPNEDFQLTQEDDASGFLFNAQMTSYLVQMMSLEVDSGRASGGLFNKTTWPRIHKKFNRYFKVAYRLDQITAKYRRIKKDYQTFQYLKSHTGFGWNETLQVPTAPDSTWANVIRVRSNAARFKKHTLPHYDMLHKIFGGSTATGRFACNSTQQHFDDDDDDPDAAAVQDVPYTYVPDDAPNNTEDMSTSTRNTCSKKGKGPMTTSQLKKKGRKVCTTMQWR